MIDHISVGVADLEQAKVFYEQLLSIIGYQKLVERSTDVGFGKKYPEFWLNHRPDLVPQDEDTGTHICFRASSVEQVDAFHQVAIRLGASCSGKPGYRKEYSNNYYAAFIKDANNHKIEVVTFT
jgi:catechol 2,3-dioxygenase-like lactoylglutathione lyase family enzyme